MEKEAAEGSENHQTSGTWLNLSLGVNTSSAASSSSSQSGSTSHKVFSCKFCMRRFFSSQSLGGHQNAHKRERDADRRSNQTQRMMMDLPYNPPFLQSLRVHPHSNIHKPHKDNRIAMVARFDDVSPNAKMAWASFSIDEAMDTGWCLSFRNNSQQHENSSEIQKIDLNLRL